MQQDNQQPGGVPSPRSVASPRAGGQQPERSKSPSGKSGWIVGILLLAMAGGGAFFWQKKQAESKAAALNAGGTNASPAGAGGGAGRGGRGGGGPVPVIAGKVVQKDVPIYLDGLGTVQAFNMVTIHARVDGQLEKVAFVEGQDVHAGDLLAQIDPAPYQAQLAQNQAKKAQDEAQLANANLDLKREQTLFADKIDSQQLLDTQQATVNQLTAAVKADAAAIDSAQVQLNYATITSPIDGRTGIRQIDQGNIVHATDANGLVAITQLRPISVIFTLPEQNLGEIHKQMESGELKVLAMDHDNKTLLDEGKLTVIDNAIDTTTATIKLKATFANEKLKLWPGQFVNARLMLTVRKGGMVVPASVIQRGPNGAYAFVFGDDLKAQIRPVKVAQIENGEALVEEGLRAGERVVVDGQYKLQPGSIVKPGPAGKPGAGKPAEDDAG